MLLVRCAVWLRCGMGYLPHYVKLDSIFPASPALARLDAALSLCASDVVFESTTAPDGERVVGHASLRKIWKPIFENPGTHIDVEETIATGDRVLQRCLYSWGDGHVRAIDLYRIRDGKIVEKLSYVKG